MDIDEVIALLEKNAQAMGLTLDEALAGKAGPADEAGKRQLTGKTIQYQSDDGIVSVSIDNEDTLVKIGDGGSKKYITHATLVAEGVYFISWAGDHSGNHIVFNSHTMKVYKQIMPDRTRQEGIYEVISFADSAN